jgi:hypothetical protein
MNFYMNHGTDWIEPIARDLYAEIAMVEEEHVTHYESLLDPLDSWLKQLVFHEYNEVYLYWSMMQHETDRRIKQLWELHLDMELGQLQVACELLRKYEGVEPAEILPRELPETPITFEPNKQYVREVLAATADLRPDGLGYTPAGELPDNHRFFQFQETAHAGGTPSEMVIDQNRATNRREYRDETEGAHPIYPLSKEALR